MHLRPRSAACAQMLLLVMLVIGTTRATALEEDTTIEIEAYEEGWITTPSESDDLKDLKCPELDPYVPSPCAFLCGGCTKGQICCRNNCGGTECMEPAKPHIPTEKELRFWKLYEQSIKPLKKNAEEKSLTESDV